VSAAAQPICASYSVVVNQINRQDEFLKWRGLSGTGQHIAEVFTDEREGEKGGFTVVIRSATGRGMACVLFSGFDWENVQGETPWRIPQGEES
jgi:hypothetical protein